MHRLPASLAHRIPAVILTLFGLLVGAAVGPDTLHAQAPGNGRAVLVTGASSGIGLRMTEELAANGFYVYAGARSAGDLAMLDAMENVSSVRLDVTEQDEIDAAVAWVEAQGRGLYGLINNAGVGVIESLLEISEDDMWFQQDVNLFGPWRVTKAFAPMLIESRGRISTTGSISGILSGRMFGAYSMSKHGVEAFTDALANDLLGTGVTVSVIEPGNYRSDIVDNLMARLESQGYGPDSERWKEMMEVFGGDRDRTSDPEPDDVARAALDFMATDTPRRRYLVVPVEREARITIEQIVREMVQMNQTQAFTYTRDELIEILDAMLAEVQGAGR